MQDITMAPSIFDLVIPAIFLAGLPLLQKCQCRSQVILFFELMVLVPER